MRPGRRAEVRPRNVGWAILLVGAWVVAACGGSSTVEMREAAVGDVRVLVHDSEHSKAALLSGVLQVSPAGCLTVDGVVVAAARLDCHKNTVYHLIETGQLDAFRLTPGGKWKITGLAIDEFIQAQKSDKMSRLVFW